MIGGMILLCTLIIAFYEKPHLFKRPINAGKTIIVTLLLVSAGFSFYKEYTNDLQQEHNSRTIDSLQVLSGYQNGQISILNTNVDTFRRETKIAQRQLGDSIAAYSISNKHEVKEMAYEMSERFGRTSKINLEAHQRTQKKLDSVSGIRPAFVHFISEPSNVLKIEYKDGLLITNCIIENAGDLPAYNLGGKVYLLAMAIGGGTYNLTGNGIPYQGMTLAARNTRPYQISVKLNKEMYSRISGVCLLVDLNWCLDYALKDERVFSRNLKKNFDEAMASYYAATNEYLLNTSINKMP